MHTALESTIKYFKKCKSNPKAVEKGLQIFESNSIEYIQHGDEIVTFFAKVPDDNSGSTHTTWVKVYKSDGDFVEGGCTCSPNKNYELLCKHIVAVTLTIQNDLLKPQ